MYEVGSSFCILSWHAIAMYSGCECECACEFHKRQLVLFMFCIPCWSRIQVFFDTKKEWDYFSLKFNSIHIHTRFEDNFYNFHFCTGERGKLRCSPLHNESLSRWCWHAWSRRHRPNQARSLDTAQGTPSTASFPSFALSILFGGKEDN